MHASTRPSVLRGRWRRLAWPSHGFMELASLVLPSLRSRARMGAGDAHNTFTVCMRMRATAQPSKSCFNPASLHITFDRRHSQSAKHSCTHAHARHALVVHFAPRLVPRALTGLALSGSASGCVRADGRAARSSCEHLLDSCPVLFGWHLGPPLPQVGFGDHSDPQLATARCLMALLTGVFSAVRPCSGFCYV
jgi:hypothetical protein